MFRRIFTSNIIPLLLVVAAIIYAPDIRTYIEGAFSSKVKNDSTQTEQVPDIDTTSDTAVTSVSPAGEDTFVQEYKGPLSINEIFDATNKERTQAGLTPLKTNVRLIRSAKYKVEDMIKKQYFEHTAPDGKTVSDLADAQGYTYIILGENLAVGDFTNSTDLLDAWMKSPGHRANILNPKYQEVGVYAAKGTYKGKKVWFAVQHFGTSQSVCPSINQNLKNSIDLANKDLKQKEAVIEGERAILEAPNAALSAGYKDHVATFNSLVTEYNALLGQVKVKIISYNNQVHLFNTCIAVFQKGGEKAETYAAH